VANVHKSFKSSNFLNAIDKYAKRQKSKITDEIKEIEKRELEKAEAEIMEDVNSMIQKERVSMKNKIVVEISHKELEERKKVSLRRRDMMKEIFKQCRKELIEFTLSEKYAEALKSYASGIAEVLKETDTELFVKESDMKYADVIKSSFGRDCGVSAAKDILIGGIRGYSASRGLIVDETLDAKLKDQEDWAAENFGVLLV
jgi:vacuolar-type H+-ATPase subunit E/Vma4